MIGPRRRRRIAEHMAMVVMALQVSLVLAMALVPGEPPRVQMNWLELLWSSARRPMFYLLLAALIGGPALTLLAVRQPGRHRAWLALAWCAFSLVLMILFARRVAVMLDVLWRQMGW